MSERCRVEVTASEIKVVLQGIPHLVLRRSDVVGVQGYIKNIGPAVPIYFVEVTTSTGQVVCDYAERGLWEDVLVGMADARMFDERMGEVTA